MRIGFWCQTSKICAIVVINGNKMMQGSLTVSGHKFVRSYLCDPCVASDPCNQMETRLTLHSSPAILLYQSNLQLTARVKALASEKNRSTATFETFTTFSALLVACTFSTYSLATMLRPNHTYHPSWWVINKAHKNYLFL